MREFAVEDKKRHEFRRQDAQQRWRSLKAALRAAHLANACAKFRRPLVEVEGHLDRKAACIDHQPHNEFTFAAVRATWCKFCNTRRVVPSFRTG